MTEETNEHRIAVIGLGKLGGILLRAFLDNGLVLPENVRATVHREENADLRAALFGVQVSTDNLSAVEDADLVLLCVKPAAVRAVCEQIAPVIDHKLVISVAASVPTSLIEEPFDEVPVVRAMSGTPAAVGAAMTGLCAGTNATDEHLALARALFDAVGRTVILDEKHMDAVTGLSASGPAFIYVIIESLAEAGVKVGLPRDVATTLAAQATLGAAGMVLDTGNHPALLKDEVTTPAGCTIDGLLELEDGGLRVTLIKAVVKATERAGELKD
ncbi:MAG TPA: pyrroline-5-carboxylate reductase [Acidobacteriota bacterium]|nr:pyrroline-5-carboxylate reductase [Acidobacteriota bacterium]